MVSPTASPAPSTPVDQLIDEAKSWSGTALNPHPDRGVAFRLDRATIGVLHPDGLLEVPVPQPVRSVLVDEEWAQPHPTRTGADWVAMHVRSSDDVETAALLLRLAYLYRRLLRSPDAETLRRIRIELAQHDVPDALGPLYDAMLDKRNPGSSTLPGTPSSS